MTSMGTTPSSLLGGRYRLLHRVGHGNMSDVWVARDERLDREVAIKLVTSEDDAERARVLREARTIAAINHPHVVTVHDAVEDGQVAAVVMELVHDGTLADRIRERGPIPWRAAVGYALEVAAGLEAAHASGLVHRDVKPPNVLVRGDGSLAVADFGIAGATGAASTTTTIRGSIPYAAPEQIQGRRPDPRTDVYALGCVLVEMLTGSPPFVGEPPAVLDQHLHQSARAVRVDVPEVPVELDALLARMLAKDPRDRPQNMAEARTALAACREGRTGTAALPPSRVAMRETVETAAPRRSHWLGLAVTPVHAAIAGALLGTLILFAWSALVDDGTSPLGESAVTVGGRSEPAVTEVANNTTPQGAQADPDTPETVDEAVRAFRSDLAGFAAEGEATDKALEKLEDKVGEVQDKALDDPREATKKARELERELRDLAREDELTEKAAAALAPLAADVTDLAAAAARSAPGEDEDEDDD